MRFVACMILLPDKTFLNLCNYLRKSTVLILKFCIYFLGSNRDQMSEQIFNGAISLKHAIPFDPNIDIVKGKLWLLALNFLIASAYLLRIYIICIWLLIHTIFHLNISFSVEINSEVVFLFWYESFNFWRCSSFHLCGLHLALGAWDLRNFVVRIRFVTFQTHRKIILLLFQGCSGHVFPTTLTFDGSSMTNICPLSLT